MTNIRPPSPTAYIGEVAVPWINRPFPPNSTNTQFNVPSVWTDYINSNAYMLVSKLQGVADWILLGGSPGVLQTLMGNSGPAVAPDTGTINIVGGTGCTVVGNAGTHTLTINVGPGGDPFDVNQGGTGRDTLTAHNLLVGNGTSPVSLIATAAAGYLLAAQGGSADPTYLQPTCSNGSLTLVTNGSTLDYIIAAPVSVANGGQGHISLTSHAVLIGNGTSAISQISPSTAGNIFIAKGGSADPAFITPTAGNGLTLVSDGTTFSYGITAPVSAANGGTGRTTLLAHSLLVGNGTGTVDQVGPGTLGQMLIAQGASDPIFLSPTSGNGTAVTSNGSVFSYAMSSPFTGNFIFEQTTASTPCSLTIESTSNTASSAASLNISVAGTSAGNPSLNYIITGGNTFSAGITQSDGLYRLTTGAGVTGSTLVRHNTGNTGVSSLGAMEVYEALNVFIDMNSASPIPGLYLNAARTDGAGTSPGFGTSVVFNATNASNSNVLMARVTSVFTDTTAGAESAYLTLQAVSSAVLTESMRFYPSGAVLPAGKNIIMNTSAGAMGTTTPNGLGIYEVGTWTPTLVGSSVAGSTTYVDQHGYYTRIGNLVYIQGYIQISAATGTGNAVIGGLPFTVLNETSGSGSGSINLNSSAWAWPASTTYLNVVPTINTTTSLVQACGSATASSAVQMTNGAAILSFTLVYQV